MTPKGVLFTLFFDKSTFLKWLSTRGLRAHKVTWTPGAAKSCDEGTPVEKNVKNVSTIEKLKIAGKMYKILKVSLGD